MKNKIKLKKYLMISIITVVIFSSISLILNIFSYKVFNKNVNETINEIIVNVKKNYPEADVNEIIQILNSNNTNKIIEKDNGYIIVKSEVGAGTTFQIRYMK